MGRPLQAFVARRSPVGFGVTFERTGAELMMGLPRCVLAAIAAIGLAACEPVADQAGPVVDSRAEACRETVSVPGPVDVETPCPDRLTPDLIATLQRALKVRGLYDGAVDGRLGSGTRAAVKRYQAARGLPTDVLTFQSAKELGLIAYSREELLAAA